MTRIIYAVAAVWAACAAVGEAADAPIPTVTPDGTAAIKATTSVTLASTGAGVICSTTDGTTAPSCNAGADTCAAGDAGTTVSVTKSLTLKAIACKGTGSTDADSAVVTKAFTWTPDDVTFSPVAGGITAAEALTLTSTGAANICFTKDGSAPTCNADGTCLAGSTYSGSSLPSATKSETFKAIGCGGTDKGNSAAVASAAYTATAQAVTVSPDGGAIVADTAVTLASVVSTNICYTLDGDAPVCAADGATCTTGIKYDGTSASTKPSVTKSASLKAIGCGGTGGTNSAVKTSTAFTATAQAVSVTPNGGAITASTEVTLASVVSTNICYTSTGTAPVCAADGATCTTGTKYDGSSKPSATKASTFKAIGCGGTGGTNSAVASAAFTWTAVNPTVSPAAGNVAKDSAVTLTSAGSANICYTWTGTAPACKTDGTCETNSTAYNATAKPTVSATKTLKAIGCAGTDNTDSAVVTAAYTVNTTTTAAATTAAPAATTTVSGASSEAAWSTMLTVFAIAMAAFSTL